MKPSPFRGGFLFKHSMGTIRKQSIYSSIFIYGGFLIGAINVLLLFPRYFTPEEFGLTRILMDISLVFATICTAGTIPVVYKFHPFYQKYLTPKTNDLLAITLLTSLLGCIILFFCMPYLQPLIFRKFGARSPILSEYFYLAFPLTVSLVAFTMLEAFAWVVGKSVVANFMKEFMFRILASLLIVCWIFGWITDFKFFISGFSLLYVLPTVVLAYLVYKSREYGIFRKPSKVTQRLRQFILRFGTAYFLSALLNILAKTNDTLIIASQSTGGMADAAIFTIATYLITVMDVPQRSMIAPAIPQISAAWKDKDMPKLERLYQKTALNLLIIAAGILGLVIINMDLLVALLGNRYALIPTLLLILGSSKLIDLGSGLNSQILQLSKHWKIDLFTNMLFVAASILFNYILTKKFGLLGTAWGTLIAVVLFNLIRFIYIKKIYGLQPFSWKNGMAVVTAGILAAGCYLLHLSNHMVVNSIINSVIFTASFGMVMIRLNISEDINSLFQMLISRWKRTQKNP